MPAVIKGGRRQTSRPPARRAPQGRGRASAPPPRGPWGRPLSPAMAWGGVAVVGAGFLALAAAVGWLNTAAVAAGQAGDEALAALGFRLEQVHVVGASDAGERAILDELRLRRDLPLAGLNLESIRNQVEAVGWVSQARVVRLLPNTLVIEVSERRPMAVWQRAGVLTVVDGQGQVIQGADPRRYPELLYVVGDGADRAAPDLAPLVEAWPRLRERLDAAIRVDDRRWNLLLRGGGIIQLPADGADAALVQLEAMDQRRALLDRGFARVDMRTAEVRIEPRGAV